MRRTGNEKEEMQEEILWEIGEGLSAPPSAELQAHTAAEAGCSLLSTHMGQWGPRDVEPLTKASGTHRYNTIFGSAPSNQGLGPRG